MNVLHEPNYMTRPKVKNIVKIVRPNVYENNHFFFFWYRDRFSSYHLLNLLTDFKNFLLQRARLPDADKFRRVNKYYCVPIHFKEFPRFL